MTQTSETTEPETEESECEVPERLTENEAVAQCVRAWRITIANERDEDADEFEAEKTANDAFLAAMPPLRGYENICDFIACVTQAYMLEVVRQKEAEHLLVAAKIALGALRLEPNPAGSVKRRAGRPRKNNAPEGK
jgi:hypothetical protein